MSSSLKSKSLIALRVLFGLAFLAASVMKLSGQPQMVAEFQQIGLGQWFRLLTGSIELIGALLLIRRPTVAIGAALLTCVSIGAFVTQLMVLHGDVIHTLVFAAAMCWLVYSYRPGRVAA
ncbi:DoxX family protein [Xanthomonas phaseoli]|uniref:DoxX family protein n=1 Tax=Xanthomonas phaseoli TaxID=1985254 RepID=UPI00123830B8|nr:DoxX family protein [Xanthomonas phaseoli]MBO9831160.1 DoxX family protein [Xanthomonas phaseoli pv. dieffenbachiae]MBO9837495.1 DoxX family protein [Xanthomonas phaseoli pv. dieffenbachiae]MBO9839265.1 DoxX family protein [Xanthomonas phaseoli pv. dieffenbachiae]MBO9861130.1 DoxX family protein [Xanthomonas phaseoli pv. dieffenbachiae]MBO9865006.1 DoxX family protein [Xanthomonas phaseoli pv. dieffenbachiae]